MSNIVVVVALNFKDLSIPQVIERSRIIRSAIIDNANFLTPNPEPNPALDVVTGDIDALEEAYLAADGGDKTLKALMRSKKATLLRSMNSLRAYVQTIANMDHENGETIVLSAGMALKSFPSHGPQIFAVVNTGNRGELKLTTKALIRAAYIWQSCIDPGAEANWQAVGHSTKASLTLSGLTSGTRYFFRVAVIDHNGLNPWSHVLNSIVL